MNILMHGCNGRMGQVITRLASSMTDVTIICGVDSNVNVNVGANANANANVAVSVNAKANANASGKGLSNTASTHHSYPVYSSLAEIAEADATEVDVIIDFSNHTTVDALIEFSRKYQVGLVLCTTGYTVEEKDKILEASKLLPIFNSGNMSIGINLMISLLKQATSKLFADDASPVRNGTGNCNGIGNANNTHHDFDIEIIEKHHNQKLDAPSGTAIMLAEAINSTLEEKMDYVYERESKMQKRSNHEIGIHSIRGGAIVGEHEVIFAGAGEVIELKHTALSRDVFGVGALKAAKFMYLKPAGLYNMQDVLETK